MCLYRSVQYNPLRIAKDDIVCYKVVNVVWADRRKFKTKLLRSLHLLKRFETWYQDAPITLGETVSAEPEYTKQELEEIDKRYITIAEGFIHSFKTLDDAKTFVKRAYLSAYATIVKCVIPKGTYYFTGEDSNGVPGYASCQLKYVKVVQW